MKQFRRISKIGPGRKLSTESLIEWVKLERLGGLEGLKVNGLMTIHIGSRDRSLLALITKIDTARLITPDRQP